MGGVTGVSVHPFGFFRKNRKNLAEPRVIIVMNTIPAPGVPMARYSVGAYTYEDDSVIPQIFDEVTGSPVALGSKLISRERGDTVTVEAMGIRLVDGSLVPFVDASMDAANLFEYQINAEKSPDTGEWVLAGYWAVS